MRGGAKEAMGAGAERRAGEPLRQAWTRGAMDRAVKKEKPERGRKGKLATSQPVEKQPPIAASPCIFSAPPLYSRTSKSKWIVSGDRQGDWWGREDPKVDPRLGGCMGAWVHGREI